jgi:hypothetical protein
VRIFYFFFVVGAEATPCPTESYATSYRSPTELYEAPFGTCTYCSYMRHSFLPFSLFQCFFSL